ncbi:MULTISPECIES: metallophosphoesterase family protein [Paenibacillus]|uniref:metallophosphoesterase family protein n=1 Tax=Paenibacillus TaxID=44249 RepID=UPI0022B87AB0|nr:metallophosphoesterase [Paenibacillus caseinilyticus]MCZ8521892.1 metallophosphoesterase [Paenibacillus caseinilyticus]
MGDIIGGSKGKTNPNGTLYTRSQKLLASRLRRKSFDPDNYKIVYMGDSWAAEGNYTGIGVLNKALDVIRGTKPLYVLHGGDIVFTGSKEQLTYFSNKVKERIPGGPLFVAVGNHESTLKNGTTSLNNFKKIIGPAALHFTVRSPYVKVIGLSSVSPNGGKPYGKKVPVAWQL